MYLGKILMGIRVKLLWNVIGVYEFFCVSFGGGFKVFFFGECFD